MFRAGSSSLRSSCNVEMKSSTIHNQKLNTPVASGCSGSMRTLRGRSKCLSIFRWLNCDTRNLRGDYHKLGFNQQKSKLSSEQSSTVTPTATLHRNDRERCVQASQWYTHANCPELSWQQSALHDWEITRGNNKQISTDALIIIKCWTQIQIKNFGTVADSKNVTPVTSAVCDVTHDAWSLAAGWNV